MQISIVQEADYLNAFETMKHLRTHLEKSLFFDQLKKQVSQGYHLVGIKEGENYVALAGYRYSTNLAWGYFLYCDDLVVHPDARRNGYADALLNFMYEEAKKNNCKSFQLDSGVQRFPAHRQYLKHYMDITCHHFGRDVTE